MSSYKLHGKIDENLLLLPPQGLETPSSKFCKLSKALYRLRQVPKQWYKEFSSKLIKFGFTQSKTNHCLFTMKSSEDYMVDNILITGTNQRGIEQLKTFLDNEFTIKDLGEIGYFLGIELEQTSEGIFISQQKYINDIMLETNMWDAKSCTTPFPTSCKLQQNKGTHLAQPDQCRRLIYLTVSKPNITYGVHQLNQYMSNPTDKHLKVALRMMKYLKGIRHLKLKFIGSKSPKPSAYCAQIREIAYILED